MATSNIFQLIFVHPEIMPKFVDHRSPDLVTDFGFAGTDRLDVLLIEHDIVRPRPQVEKALLCCWHAMEQTQKELSSPQAVGRLVGGKSSTRTATL